MMAVVHARRGAASDWPARCYSLLFEVPKTAPLVRTLDAMWLPDNTVSEIEKTHK